MQTVLVARRATPSCWPTSAATDHRHPIHAAGRNVTLDSVIAESSQVPLVRTIERARY
jgi:hypothetical protein